MKCARRIAQVFCLLTIVGLALPVAAQDEPPPTRDPAFEREIYARLEAIDPAAVPIFREATEAADREDFDEAREGYRRVLELAPGFPDAARRLSYVELAESDVEAALEHARQAFEAQLSPYNELALARAMVWSEDPSLASDALKHAREAVTALPEDPDANLVLLFAGANAGSEQAIRQASATMVDIAPEFPVGHYYAGLVMAQDGRWEAARQELLLAQELGMDPEIVQEVLQSGIARRARLRGWLRRGGYTVAGWLVGLGGLFLVGVVLSQVTMATAGRVRTGAEVQVGWLERLVRRVYRIVIAVTSVYFYASIPILIALVGVLAAGYGYFSLTSGSLYLILLALAGAGAAFLVIYAVVAAIFTRAKEGNPGPLLSREDAPQLWELAEEVGARVGTRPVDAIYLKPLPGIAVMERGSLRQRLRGAGERCLVLGMGSLPGLTQNQLRAVLAHEYGHFLGGDPAGGRLAGQVQYSIRRLAGELASAGQNHWYNPVWLFIQGYYRIFMRITRGASRLQEVLADRHAVAAYGVRDNALALEHMVRQDMVFQVQALSEIGEARQEGRACRNLYTLPPLESALKQKVDAKLEDSISRPTSPYDSHPAFEERLALFRSVEDTLSEEDTGAPVWELLPDSETLQEEMSALVEANVRKAGTWVPVEPESPPDTVPPYRSKSSAVESPALSRRVKALRLWAHLGSRKSLWVALLMVLLVVDAVLLDVTLRGDGSYALLAIGGLPLVLAGILSLAPRSTFVPCPILLPTRETERHRFRLKGKLYRAHLSGQSDSDGAAAWSGPLSFSRASHRFANAPFDLMVGDAGTLTFLLKRQVRQGSTGFSSWSRTTTAAASAPVPMASPQYWGVQIRPEELSDVCPGAVFGRWDRPALRFTHAASGGRRHLVVTFSSFAVYEQVAGFLKAEGFPMEPPAGLVLPEVEDLKVSTERGVTLFRLQTS